MGQKIYIGTVGLDRNRWGSRMPSLKVSDWLDRFRADGFDGIELWAYHYIRADEEEQARLANAGPLAVYNSYVGFDDDAAEERAEACRAIEHLQARAVKYNLGKDASRLETYRRNLMTWAQEIPQSCRLLCECHGGTVLEDVGTAVDFFRDLHLERFGVIAHLSGNPEDLANCFDSFGARIQHLHVQFRDPAQDPTVTANRPALDACFDVLRKNEYAGTISLEFSRGIGRKEQLETIYRNTRADLAYVREALAR